MTKKKTAIITWITYPNFGTYLQAFALQYYILSLGYDNAILDDSFYTYAGYCNRKKGVREFIFRLLRKIKHMFEFKKKRQKALFDSFKKHYMNIDKMSYDTNYLNRTYDIFICGSDQIWNPYNEYPGRDFYYAQFTDKEKISYAPSIGVTDMPDDKREIFKSRIQSFKALSGREQPGCDIMHELTCRKVTKVLDPTLLLGIDDYIKLIDTSKPSKDFVLIYLLSWNENYYEAAKRYADIRGLKIQMFNLPYDKTKSPINAIDAGPIEFLQSIYDAAFVFTDSFHGSIFATIFETQFITFKRFNNPINNQNSRVDNLLEIMDIKDHLLDNDDLSMIDAITDINFQKAKNNLKQHQQISKSYLINSL